MGSAHTRVIRMGSSRLFMAVPPFYGSHIFSRACVPQNFLLGKFFGAQALLYDHLTRKCREKQRNIQGEQGAQVVDIIQIVADDADAGHVLDVGIDVVDADLRPRRRSLSMMLSSDLIRYSMWWMGEWSYRRANSSSRISICVTATLQRTAVQVRHPHHAAASSWSFGERPAAVGMSRRRMVPLFFDHHGQTPSLSAAAHVRATVSSYYMNMTCL